MIEKCERQESNSCKENTIDDHVSLLIAASHLLDFEVLVIFSLPYIHHALNEPCEGSLQGVRLEALPRVYFVLEGLDDIRGLIKSRPAKPSAILLSPTNP